MTDCRGESSQHEIVQGKARYNGRDLADWVDEVVARIFERTDATKVIVFGSVVRGDDGPDSDIDLLVVLPSVVRQHDAAVGVLRQLRDVPVPIDVVVADGSVAEASGGQPGIVRVAIREGHGLERAT